jgi:pimeloyl-ACP methyl ester carboxylesterase
LTVVLEPAGGRIRSIAEWKAAGLFFDLCGIDVFTLAAGPFGDELAEPLLVIHGFPTCSFDYRLVVDSLAAHRRVLLLDLPGFGLSAKPDIRYSVELHADVVTAFVSQCGCHRLALLTHDMGDTVGGELLARQLDGAWDVEVTRRVITNGSIYIDMARLTDGQKLLLALDDEAISPGPDRENIAAALAATMAPASMQGREGTSQDAELVCARNGASMLPRTIRYVEDRRRAEHRYTGAVESHPSALTVVWGTEDPIAVHEMASLLHERRPDSTLSWLEGVGHYPMLEAPEDFQTAVAIGLGSR